MAEAIVRCVDCGLLAIRDRRFNQLVEVDEAVRVTGTYVDEPERPIPSPRPPMCAVLAYDICEETLRGKSHPLSTPKEFLKTINRERNCKPFRKWNPGFSPKEHIEMMFLEKQEEWQRQCLKEDRRWRVFELFVMAVIVTFVSVAAQIFAAFGSVCLKGARLQNKFADGPFMVG